MSHPVPPPSLPIGAAPPTFDMGWRLAHLGRAPHRLAFAAAGFLLIAATLWWLGVWLTRAGLPGKWPQAFDPGLLHGALMTYGFMPLFFAGFLFTAGPKWLDVPAPGVRVVALAILPQVLGWLLWLGASVLGVQLALVGAGIAALGLTWATLLLAQLLRRSAVPDRLHAGLVLLAHCIGIVALLGMIASVWDGQHDRARVFLVSGLWGFVASTFVVVAHRMIPFFTATALSLSGVWRPRGVLALMLLALCMKVLSVWADWAGWTGETWALANSFWKVVSGILLLWLAFVWGLMQSLQIKLLAMLHLGFLWLGIGLLLDGLSHAWAAFSGVEPLYLGALHATTMGFMGSLMLAMVTRVSCGHGGRPLVANGLVWALFCLLQVATLLRLAASTSGDFTVALTLASVSVWTCSVVPWCLHLLNWWGRPRRDGQPG